MKRYKSISPIVRVSTCIAFVLVAVILINISCRKKDHLGPGNPPDGTGPTGLNHAPKAHAGPDQFIVLPKDSINVSGAGSSDVDNNIASYVWSKISGPPLFTIENPTAVQTKFKNLKLGVYNFELKVTDSTGWSSRDTMEVSVSPFVPVNLPPVARAGNDTIIQTNQNSCSVTPTDFILNGMNSTDPDGTIASYLWTGPMTISSPTSATTTVSKLMPGINWFLLKVTDNEGASAYDTLKITFKAGDRLIIPAQLVPFGTLSQARGPVTMATAGNKILFAGGGVVGPGCVTSRVDIYDLSSNSWTTAELSVARYGMGTASLGDKIFFGGGFKPGNFAGSTGCYISSGPETRSSAIDIYDVATNTWSTSQLSSPRVPKGAAATNKLVFAGGEDMYMTSQASNLVDIFDQVSNSWTTFTLSEVKGLPQIATANHSIFLAGGANHLDGDNWAGITKRIDVLNASSGSWSVESLVQERAEMASISVNNKVYWAGGYVNSLDPNYGYEPTTLVEIRDLASNLTTLDCLSEPRAELTGIKKGNKILFLSGYSPRFDIYDVATQSWSIGVLNQELYGASFLSVNDIVYVVGNLSSNSGASNQVWKLEF